MKTLIVGLLVIGGLAISAYFNVMWMWQLLVDIIDALRGTAQVSSGDIAWMIVKLIFRSVIIILSTLACLIPSILAFVFLAED